MKPIIEIKNLNFIYNKGKDNEFHALININLEIYPEEYIIIFGPSGCGKSTLLNVIAGLEVADNGVVNAMGRDLTKLNNKDFAMYHRKEIGMIYQQYNLITSLSVLDNVSLPQIFLDISKGKRDAWGKQLLERFGILKQAHRIPTELSGGQQQRIGIARSIVNNPQLILADEPVGNLDSVSAENVLQILDELNEKEKKTIIMVTHNPENLIYADRIIYMKDGAITKEVVNHEKRKKDKKEGSGKSELSELKEIMRAYQGLTPEQINILIMPFKSKIFAHYFIARRTLEETRVLEDIIQKRLLNNITHEEFAEILHKPSADGGVGFDIRTAQKIIRKIDRIIRIAYFISQKYRQRVNFIGEHEKIGDEEKTQKLTDYLLKTCYYKHYQSLKKQQVERLRLAVKEKMIGNIQKNDFYKFLDLPYNKGGVGLNSKTAEMISEELDLIIIIGFGVSQKKIINPNQTPNNQISGEMTEAQLPQSTQPTIDIKQASDGNLALENATSTQQPVTPNTAFVNLDESLESVNKQIIEEQSAVVKNDNNNTG
jgi:putative ABC transport system ATP-binding protein